jgi:hypothetical protein
VEVGVEVEEQEEVGEVYIRYSGLRREVWLTLSDE